MNTKSNVQKVPKFEQENQFVRKSEERQDFFMVHDGVVWYLFQYICIESGAYSPGSVEMPDLITLNLGGGRWAEIHGRSLLRVLSAFHARQIVSLELGETKDMAISAIEVNARISRREKESQEKR